MANSKILTAEQEKTLRQPIEEYVGKIQKEIDELRKDGTAKVIMYQSRIENVKRDKTLSKGEKDSEIASCQKELEQAKAVEAQNKDQIAKLIGKAENYLKNNFDKYYNAVKASCIAEKEQALQEHQQKLAKIEKEHKETLAKTSAQAEVKEENYVYKNRVSNEKIELEKEYQRIKDRKHDAYSYKYHLIDLLRLSKFTFAENQAQKWENYKYTFNRRTFLLQNGLYIAIILIFVALCIITPIKKGTPLLTYNNILNILQQASPRMFLALGVAGLILLTGTDLSVGRMVGMGMTTATIIMHQGVNTGGVFGHIFDFTKVPTPAGVPALNDVSLEIEDGEFVFVVGDSGSGKSTLIKLLLKELEPTEGSITIAGKKLGKIRRKQIPKFRRNIGVVFQDFRLLKDRNVYDNVAFAQKVVGEPNSHIKKKVPLMLSMVGLAAKYRSFPKQLSGGEQQRVAIARALINEPSILLADEPTGNLDNNNAWEIMKLLEEINSKGTTVIVVTHNLEIVKVMKKRVITVKKGTIVSDSKEGGYDDEN